MAETERYIGTYFRLGLQYKQIMLILKSQHDINLSMRTLERCLFRMGLTRRKRYTDLLQLALFVQEELETYGQLHGYRWLHNFSKAKGLVCRREDIRILLGLLDPEGVAVRLQKRLRRRIYFSRGPNYLWHMDSYDKLKPYGICINGCIDGYSRYVVWLEAYKTNSDPKVIAGYFTKAVLTYGGCPSRIRADKGTENGHVEVFQKFFRRNHTDEFAGEKSFIYGPSTRNQRIEAWWLVARKHGGQFWMDLFCKLEADGHFTGSFLDKNLIQFCFMNVIQVRFSCQLYFYGERNQKAQSLSMTVI